MKNKINIYLILSLLLFLTAHRSEAQIKNSVYSMFGIGQITDKSYGINKSLGGTGIAFQSGRSVNYLNPASYLGIAPNSFVMELGLNGMLIDSKQQSVTQSVSDLNFSYASASLYITRWWAFSFGIVPYSTIDYEINSIDEIGGESTTTFEKNSTGSGGLNRIYWGNSFELLKGLSMGINTCYIFGHILQTETAENNENYLGYELINNRYAGSIYFDYGVQFSIPSGNWQYTIGGIYGAGKTLNTTDNLEITYNSITTTLTDENKSDIKIPQKFGVGISAKNGDSFRCGIDYERNNWSNINFSNTNINTKDSQRFSFGVEYCPAEQNEKRWLKTLFYRLGANYKESHLELNGTKINSFGINFGIGIPFDMTSMINISAEYGKEGTLDRSLIENSYWRLHLNISLHEFWATNIGRF